MYDTTERVKRVKQLSKKLRRKRKNRQIGGLTGLCVLLALSLVGVQRRTTGGGSVCTPGMYGTLLLFDDAGAYVLVGVLAFTAGVTITLLCLRHRGKKKNAN